MGRDNAIEMQSVRAIPRQPHISRPVRALVLAAGSFALVFVILGSLTPFTLDTTEMRRMGWSAIGRLGWPHSDARDVVINLGVYIPVGLTLWMLFAGRVSRTAALPAAILTGMILSFSLETLQQFVATRYPSWIDVMVNTAGTTTGAAIAWLTVPLLVRFLTSPPPRRPQRRRAPTQHTVTL